MKKTEVSGSSVKQVVSMSTMASASDLIKQKIKWCITPNTSHQLDQTIIS
jgi:hypothetical protein